MQRHAGAGGDGRRSHADVRRTLTAGVTLVPAVTLTLDADARLSEELLLPSS